MAKALFSMGGSSGLGWSDFLEICQTCDELGLWGFYPSDHLMQVGQGRGPTRVAARPVVMLVNTK